MDVKRIWRFVVFVLFWCKEFVNENVVGLVMFFLFLNEGCVKKWK